MQALDAAVDAPLLLLHCVSGYPTPPEDCNLRTIPHLAQAFGVDAGLSDHTHGAAVPVAAAALGAVVIEKHFTLSRADGGVDSAFSLEPAEFKAMGDSVRTAWAALGRVHYGVKPSEAGGRGYRRSLYVTADVAAGEALTAASVRSIRPGFGMEPKHLPAVLGRRAARALRRGEPLHWDMLAPEEE
ncbi:N-acetylneuraminate synthase family protein [Azospirillum formosense]|uniref:N-acetylneuraminate synthase family protein n=1 Tax=Azospirillum formosense TaxID=861533 RepID=UPI002494F3CD|nr:N-acetylneuraminate synthase family protein [Azospirillum formosense]